MDINQVDLGAAYLAENQDRTLSSTIPGGNAVATDLMRAFRGYGQINQFWGRGWNTYHSIQSSFNRRFSNGLVVRPQLDARTVNTSNSGARLEHGANGTLQYRADQEEADEILGRGQLQRHTIKGNFVWDLPDLERAAGGAKRVLAAVTNDWQLSGIYTGQIGGSLQHRLQLPERRRQREHHRLAELRRPRVINGDPGSGCSDNQYQQFNTAAFSGPPIGSVGLESGQNYMNGLLRELLGSGDRAELPVSAATALIQLRLEMFNALQHGGLLGAKHDRQHPEPDGSDRDQSAPTMRKATSCPAGSVPLTQGSGRRPTPSV